MKPKQTFYSKGSFNNDKLVSFNSKAETKTTSSNYLNTKKPQLSRSLPKIKNSKIKPLPKSLLGSFRQNIPSKKLTEPYSKQIKVLSKSDYSCHIHKNRNQSRDRDIHLKSEQIQKIKSIPSFISPSDSKYRSFFNEKESRNHNLNKSSNYFVDKGKLSFSVNDNNKGISIDSVNYFPNHLIVNRTVHDSSTFDVLKEIGSSSGPEDLHFIFVGVNQRKKELYRQLNENMPVPDDGLYYDYLDIE